MAKALLRRQLLTWQAPRPWPPHFRASFSPRFPCAPLTTLLSFEDQPGQVICGILFLPGICGEHWEGEC